MALATTNLSPDDQMRNMLAYDDTIVAAAGMEVTGGTIEDNLHAIISQINRIINATTGGNNWYEDINTPSALDPGAQRGVNDLNTDLHSIERKRILKRFSVIAVDIPVTTAASSTLTGTANFANTETVTLDAKVYTFQTVLTDVDGNVLIGANLAASLSNLAGAINLTGTPGAVYALSMTIHPTVYASTITATTLVATAKTQGSAGDSIATTEGGANASWPGATLGAGTGGGSTTDVIVLANSQLPSTAIAAIGAVTTEGVVVETAGTFGTGSLDEVTGANALQPKNLWMLIDSSTGETLTRTGGVADGAQVYGLGQSESAVDGSTITAGSGNGLQVSLVVRNSAGDDLELISAGDVPITVTIDYAYVRRDAFEDSPEEAWLGGGFVDSGVSTATRQAAYDNQGAMVLTTVTNAILDVGTGFTWELGDAASGSLFTITEDSAGGNTDITIGVGVDTYNNNAIDVNFIEGITVDNGTNAINLGITADQIDFTGAATITGTSTILVTADSSNASLTTTTSGNVIVSSAGSLDLDAAGIATLNTANAADASGNTIALTAGNSTAGTATGAAVTIDAGDGSGAGAGATGGAITVTAGEGGGTNGDGGSASIAGGGATGSGDAGIAGLFGGVGGATSPGGDAEVFGGSSGGGATGNGGGALIGGGSASSTNGNGGPLLGLGGSATGTGDGGPITLVSGSSTGTAGSSAGDIILRPGQRGAAGDPGVVSIETFITANESEETALFQLFNQSTGTGGGSSITQFVIESDPSVVGIVANVGSLAFRNSAGGGTVGELWMKVGAGDTAWELVDVGGVSGSLEAAWAAATGAGATLGASGFTGSITDADTYLINTVTGAHSLLSLAAVGGADVVSLGHALEASVTNVASGTGGTNIDSTGIVSLDGVGASNFTTDTGALTLATTTSGDIVINAADNASAIGGGVDIDTGDGAGTANSGAFTVNTGNALGTSGDGGNIILTTGQSIAGDAGDFTFTGGNGITASGGGFTFSGGGGAGAGTAGGFSATLGTGTGAGAAGSFTLSAGNNSSTGDAGSFTVTAGDNVGGGVAGAVSFTAGNASGGATEPGGDMTLTAGSSASTNGIGGDVIIVSGDGGGTGTGGAFTVLAGDSGTGATGTGGEVSLIAGSSVATNGAGGNWTGTAGAGAGTGNGGAIAFSSGDGGSTSGTGGQLTIAAGDSTSGDGGLVQITAGATAAAGSGGNIELRAGAGTTDNGRVRITPDYANPDTDEYLTLVATGTNPPNSGGTEDVRMFAGNRDPDGNITGTPGSLYLRGNSTSSALYVNDTSGTAAGTDWSVLTTGSTVTLNAAVTTVGATPALQDATFIWEIDDTEALTWRSNTGDHTLISLTPVSGADVVTIGHANEATVVDIDSGTGGTAIDSTGAVSLDGAAASNFTVAGAALTLSTTTSGAVSVTAADAVNLTAGDEAAAAGNDVNVTAGSATAGTGGGGDILVDAGDGFSSGDGGLISLIAGDAGATGAGGAVNIDAGASTAAVGGALVLRGGNTASGTGGAISLSAGDGGGTGDGGALSWDAGVSGSGATGDGGSLSLTAGAAISTAGSGGNITLTAGANTGAGTAGVITLANDSASVQAEPVIALDGQAAVAIQLNTGAVAPTHTAPAGSLFLFNDATNANTGGRLYVQLDADGGADDGNNWDQLSTSAGSATRQHFQTTMSADVTPTNSITSTDIVGTMPTKPASNFTFDTDAEIFLNGIILFNGSSNEVSSGTGDEIDVQTGGPTFRDGDVITIIYYQNSTAG